MSDTSGAHALESYLRRHIPLSVAMQVSVIEASPEQVVLAAPLAPNINHRDTVFGGSVSALAILAAWSVLHTKLAASDIRTRLVIQRNSISYDLAIAGEFTAKAIAPAPAAWETFLRTLTRKGRARISVSATIWSDGQQAARLDGEFVALGVE